MILAANFTLDYTKALPLATAPNTSVQKVLDAEVEQVFKTFAALKQGFKAAPFAVPFSTKYRVFDPADLRRNGRTFKVDDYANITRYLARALYCNLAVGFEVQQWPGFSHAKDGKLPIISEVPIMLMQNGDRLIFDFDHTVNGQLVSELIAG